MSKVLITGGAGYVGAVLTPYLLNKGHKITVIDLMIYGKEVLSKNPNLRVIKGDIRDTNLLEKEYKQLIDPVIINTIEDNISSLMNEYLIKQFVDQFVDDCIQNTLSKIKFTNET